MLVTVLSNSLNSSGDLAGMVARSGLLGFVPNRVGR
jgi:hypothetical protein